MKVDGLELVNIYELAEPSTPNLTSAIEFNQHLICLIITVIALVGWSLTWIKHKFFNKVFIEHRNFVHSKTLETVWTTIPALTLLALAAPSFTLLYSLEDNGAPDMSLKVMGHQWFWCYEMDDAVNWVFTLLDKNIEQKFQYPAKAIRYTCYLLLIDEMPRKFDGAFRLYETTKRVLLPIKVFLRVLITSVDVLHSWSIPNFGVKMDACPGRLNQINLTIEKKGIYFGSCYEICGIQHGFMPISLIAIDPFYFFILQTHWIVKANHVL